MTTLEEMVETLTAAIGFPPDITSDDDYVADWCGDDGQMLSVSPMQNGMLAYAFHSKTLKRHGKLEMDGEFVRASLADVITQLKDSPNGK